MIEHLLSPLFPESREWSGDEIPPVVLKSRNTDGMFELIPLLFFEEAKLFRDSHEIDVMDANDTIFPKKISSLLREVSRRYEDKLGI